MKMKEIPEETFVEITEEKKNWWWGGWGEWMAAEEKGIERGRKREGVGDRNQD